MAEAAITHPPRADLPHLRQAPPAAPGEPPAGGLPRKECTLASLGDKA